MFSQIDLRSLAEREGPERAYVSVYLDGPDAASHLDRRADRVRRLLEEDTPEWEHFEESLRLVQEHLAEQNLGEAPGYCVFASWADDFLAGYPLEKAAGGPLLWIDSSPYIRPLAELQDEYENFAVVEADNTKARIYFVTSARATEAASARGDVKNDVKKGGWSQKRYERRRDKELQGYAKDIVEKLETLSKERDFDRLILLGSKETLHAVEEALPQPLTDKLAGEGATHFDDKEALWKEVLGLFFEKERADERRLWEQIKDEYMQDGRAAAGPTDVLAAAQSGRVERLLVTRDAKVKGVRCRDCENMSAGAPSACPVCGSEDIFTVDLVNELAELAARTSGETEFADPIDGLSDVGDVAALLRY
jgi:peptide subunit release factor 1 (eRF1)